MKFLNRQTITHIIKGLILIHNSLFPKSSETFSFLKIHELCPLIRRQNLIFNQYAFISYLLCVKYGGKLKESLYLFNF